jgi:hypothetical protein
LGFGEPLSQSALADASEQPQNQISAGFLPLASWSFKGYAAPEGAFQTSLWPMSKGDIKTYPAGVIPEYQTHFGAQNMQGKTEAEVAKAGMNGASQIAAFQIVSTETVSENDVILHVRSSSRGDAKVTRRRLTATGKWMANHID